MDWQPKAGTLPGRTEMRVLMAMLSLDEAGHCPAHLDAIYGYVDSAGYPVTNETDERWQLRAWMEQRGWQIGYDQHWDVTVFLKNPGLPYMESYSYDGALRMATEHGFKAAWHPDKTTVHKRLKNLASRGLIMKVGPALWMTDERGFELAKRYRIWDA